MKNAIAIVGMSGGLALVEDDPSDFGGKAEDARELAGSPGRDVTVLPPLRNFAGLEYRGGCNRSGEVNAPLRLAARPDAGRGDHATARLSPHQGKGQR